MSDRASWELSSPDERRLEMLIARLPPRLQRSMRWLRRPSSRWARIPVGALLILGGFLSILPVFGLWMFPLGLLLLGEDIAALRRVRSYLLDRLERYKPHWFNPPVPRAIPYRVRSDEPR